MTQRCVCRLFTSQCVLAHSLTYCHAVSRCCQSSRLLAPLADGGSELCSNFCQQRLLGWMLWHCRSRCCLQDQRSISECQMEPQLLHFLSSSLLICWESSGGQLEYSHVGDMNVIPCSWLQHGPDLALADNWGMNQKMECPGPSVCLTPSPPQCVCVSLSFCLCKTNKSF